MNNEETILKILVQMQAEQKKTNERLAALESGQVKIQGDVSEIKSDIKYLWEDVERIGERVNVQEKHRKENYAASSASRRSCSLSSVGRRIVVCSRSSGSNVLFMI